MTVQAVLMMHLLYISDHVSGVTC